MANSETEVGVKNVVRLDGYDTIGDLLTAIAQAVLIHGYARVWSPRHPNDIYLAVHPPMSEVAKNNITTEYNRVWEEMDDYAVMDKEDMEAMNDTSTGDALVQDTPE